MLPHITNSQSGVNRWDPVHNSLFEIYFTLPEAIQGEFGKDEQILTEQVQTVSGLNALNKLPARVQQKFMGSTRSYSAPKIDDTSAEITVVFALNLRDTVDNFVYKLFKAWGKLAYDIETGSTTVKNQYVADNMRIVEYGRDGSIYRKIKMRDVFLFDGIEMNDEYNYESNEPVQLTVKFSTDWWVEENA